MAIDNLYEICYESIPEEHVGTSFKKRDRPQQTGKDKTRIHKIGKELMQHSVYVIPRLTHSLRNHVNLR